MIHRFFAIDEPGVDMMFVRDADSRVHWKDRWAIREFLNTKGAKVHVIRDHPYHTAGIMGGLWGMRKIEGINIEALYREHKKATPKEQRLGIDQDFLMDVLYPRISQMILVHSSQEWKYHRNEILTPFPFTYSYDIFCGRVEDVRYDESEPPKNALENKPVTRSIFNILPRKMVKLS
jgi:hypothetical protein